MVGLNRLKTHETGQKRRTWRLLMLVLVLGCAERGDSSPDRAGSSEGGSCRGLAECRQCACSASACLENDPLIAASCAPRDQLGLRPDECACEGGLCPPPQACVRVLHEAPWGAGGPGSPGNICVELCTGDADCGANRVCRRNLFGLLVCASPACISDADCRSDRCGHCVPRMTVLHGGIQRFDLSQFECVYEGPCFPGSCAGCVPQAASSPGFPHKCSP